MVRKYSTISAVLQFLVSMTLIGIVSLWTLSANKDPPSWSRLKSALYVTFSRPVFLLSLICIFNLLFLGHGSAFRTFISRRFWTVLARLSYNVYLVFPIVAGQFNSSMASPLYLTYNEMVWQMLYEIPTSFIVALFFYLFVERPISNLMFGQKSNEKQRLSIL